MPIPIEREHDPDHRVQEKCCFCWEPTTYWTKIPSRPPAKQVACCDGCAQAHRQMDVPSKRYWFLVDALVTNKSARAFVGGRQSMLKEQYERTVANKVEAQE
jgi:hypothetical protein